MSVKTISEHSKICVVGYGRFGKLWSSLLNSKCQAKIFVYETRIQHKKHFKDRAIPCVDLNEIAHMDMIFFCVPISKIEACIHELESYISPSCIVCDTCSVKVYPMTVMKRVLGNSRTILGLHPLFGPDSIDKKGHRTLVVCNNGIEKQQYNILLEFFQSLGLQVKEMSAESHDEYAVYSQALTHLLGRVLKKLPLTQGEIDTKGYISLLEIIEQTCKDSLELFYDIQCYNEGTELMWSDFQHALDDTIQELQSRKRTQD